MQSSIRDEIIQAARRLKQQIDCFETSDEINENDIQESKEFIRKIDEEQALKSERLLSDVSKWGDRRKDNYASFEQPLLKAYEDSDMMMEEETIDLESKINEFDQKLINVKTTISSYGDALMKFANSTLKEANDYSNSMKESTIPVFKLESPISNNSLRRFDENDMNNEDNESSSRDDLIELLKQAKTKESHLLQVINSLTMKNHLLQNKLNDELEMTHDLKSLVQKLEKKVNFRESSRDSRIPKLEISQIFYYNFVEKSLSYAFSKEIPQIESQMKPQFISNEQRVPEVVFYMYNYALDIGPPDENGVSQISESSCRSNISTKENNFTILYRKDVVGIPDVVNKVIALEKEIEGQSNLENLKILDSNNSKDSQKFELKSNMKGDPNDVPMYTKDGSFISTSGIEDYIRKDGEESLFSEKQLGIDSKTSEKNPESNQIKSQTPSSTNATNSNNSSKNSIKRNSESKTLVNDKGEKLILSSSGEKTKVILNKNGNPSFVSSDGQIDDFQNDENGNNFIQLKNGQKIPINIDGNDQMYYINANGDRIPINMNEKGEIYLVNEDNRNIFVDIFENHLHYLNPNVNIKSNSPSNADIGGSNGIDEKSLGFVLDKKIKISMNEDHELFYINHEGRYIPLYIDENGNVHIRSTSGRKIPVIFKQGRPHGIFEDQSSEKALRFGETGKIIVENDETPLFPNALVNQEQNNEYNTVSNNTYNNGQNNNFDDEHDNDDKDDHILNRIRGKEIQRMEKNERIIPISITHKDDKIRIVFKDKNDAVIISANVSHYCGGTFVLDRGAEQFRVIDGFTDCFGCEGRNRKLNLALQPIRGTLLHIPNFDQQLSKYKQPTVVGLMETGQNAKPVTIDTINNIALRWTSFPVRSTPLYCRKSPKDCFSPSKLNLSPPQQQQQNYQQNYQHGNLSKTARPVVPPLNRKITITAPNSPRNKTFTKPSTSPHGARTKPLNSPRKTTPAKDKLQ
ncbi:hypothetical protein TRFO_26680 [Tritrichomonas foetus]|uniref:Uncharacterized protein n=1 Tax=Tritrichomonas foetus TaxID=1144522 RepID=A0A1J4K760_9EUKA|nr:hypothetical protein TRFO_26680 [Tritrichomonas foetus]|eukprot:OHT05540.1 hypothetical protein TRFO_26680 [Tritrichomonas foetus]